MMNEVQDFKHIIITRFNVPTATWEVTREGKKPLSEEWLSDRFSIFQKYCFPSFKNQKNQNFIWLVFFDVNTSEKYKEIIYRLQSEFSKFTPVFIREFPEMQPKLLEIIPQYFDENTKYIITSDIDNDDLLHSDFTDTVQKKYKPTNNLVIDLKSGIQLTKTSDQKAFANIFNLTSGPFVSLVEDIKDFGTVIKENHVKYRHYPNYSAYDEKPLYIQFIHENNLLNDTFKNNKRLYKINFNDFGVDDKNSFIISKFDALICNASRIKNKILKKIKRK